jgi:hypothetical protein
MRSNHVAFGFFMVLYSINMRWLRRWAFRDTLRYVLVQYNLGTQRKVLKGNTVSALFQGRPYRLRTRAELAIKVTTNASTNLLNFLVFTLNPPPCGRTTGTSYIKVQICTR